MPPRRELFTDEEMDAIGEGFNQMMTTHLGGGFVDPNYFRQMLEDVGLALSQAFFPGEDGIPHSNRGLVKLLAGDNDIRFRNDRQGFGEGTYYMFFQYCVGASDNEDGPVTIPTLGIGNASEGEFTWDPCPLTPEAYIAAHDGAADYVENSDRACKGIVSMVSGGLYTLYVRGRVDHHGPGQLGQLAAAAAERAVFEDEINILLSAVWHEFGRHYVEPQVEEPEAFAGFMQAYA